MGFYQVEREVTVSFKGSAGWMGPEAQFQFSLWQDVLGGVVQGHCKGCLAVKSGPDTSLL